MIDLIKESKFFKIVVNNQGLRELVLAVVGKLVYRIDLEQTDDNFKLVYMFDLSPVIGSDANLSEEKITNLILNDSMNKGAVSRRILQED